MTRTNEFGQAIGEELPVGWQEPIIPDKKTLLGNYTRIEPLDATKHATSYSRQIIVILMSRVGLT